MVSKEDKLNLKENGHIVMKALRDIEQMPTLRNLTRYIANKYQTNAENVKEQLKTVLEKGIESGLIIRQNGKYYVYGEESETEEAVDASRQRRKRSRSRARKGKGKNRSRSRSGSRSRSR